MNKKILLGLILLLCSLFFLNSFAQVPDFGCCVGLNSCDSVIGTAQCTDPTQFFVETGINGCNEIGFCNQGICCPLIGTVANPSELLTNFAYCANITVPPQDPGDQHRFLGLFGEDIRIEPSGFETFCGVEPDFKVCGAEVENGDACGGLVTDCYCGDTFISQNKYCCAKGLTKEAKIFDTQEACLLESLCQPAAFYSITGKVVDNTGAPIEGASLTLDSETVLTDASGNYAFEEVKGNRIVSIFASAPNYELVVKTSPGFLGDNLLGFDIVMISIEEVLPEANCADNIDEDNDGAIDMCDTDCNPKLARNVFTKDFESGVELTCNDGIDNNCDGLIDCDDSSCADKAVCVRKAQCGDGILEKGVEICCTPGTELAEGQICCPQDVNIASRTDPTVKPCGAVCGDGIVQGGEQCDGQYVSLPNPHWKDEQIAYVNELDALKNLGCNLPNQPFACQVGSNCGDNEIDTRFESCDYDPITSEMTTGSLCTKDRCNDICQCIPESVCGNGEREIGEECDVGDYSQCLPDLGGKCKMPQGFSLTSDFEVNAQSEFEVACVCDVSCFDLPAPPNLLISRPSGVPGEPPKKELILDFKIEDRCSGKVKKYDIFACAYDDPGVNLSDEDLAELDTSSCANLTTSNAAASIPGPVIDREGFCEDFPEEPYCKASYNYEDLEAGKRYCFQVIATYEFDKSAESELVCVTLGDAQCFQYANQFCFEGDVHACDLENRREKLLPDGDCDVPSEICIGPDERDQAKCVAISPCDQCNQQFGLFYYGEGSLFTDVQYLLDELGNIVFDEEGEAVVESRDTVHCTAAEACYLDYTRTAIDKYYTCNETLAPISPDDAEFQRNANLPDDEKPIEHSFANKQSELKLLYDDENITSGCYGYKSKFACEGDIENACQVNNCVWEDHPLFGQFGVGVCRSNIVEQQRCDLCHDPLNNVLGFCTKEMCNLYGDCYLAENPRKAIYIDTEEVNEVYSNDQARCLPKSFLSCEDYRIEDCINSPQHPDYDETALAENLEIDLGFTNKVSTPSKDYFGFGICNLIADEKNPNVSVCIKDGNFDGVSDCPSIPRNPQQKFRRECLTDNEAAILAPISDLRVPLEFDIPIITSEPVFLYACIAKGIGFCYPSQEFPILDVKLRPFKYYIDSGIEYFDETYLRNNFDSAAMLEWIDKNVDNNSMVTNIDDLVNAYRSIPRFDMLFTRSNVSAADGIAEGESSYYTINYYSLDRRFDDDRNTGRGTNLNELNAMVVWIDATFPEINVVHEDVANPKIGGRITSNLTVLLSRGDNDPNEDNAICSGNLLRRIAGGIPEIIPTTSHLNFNNVSIFDLPSNITYPYLLDDVYIFRTECVDEVGNRKTNDAFVEIENDISIKDPEPEKTLAQSQVLLSIKTSLDAEECRFSETTPFWWKMKQDAEAGAILEGSQFFGDLKVGKKTNTKITVTWQNPIGDPLFSGTQVLFNGNLSATYSSLFNSHNFLNLEPSTEYNITVIALDTEGFPLYEETINVITDVEAAEPDTTAPGTVSNINSQVIGDTIVWTWTNPPDSDFAKPIIYIDDEPISLDGIQYGATRYKSENQLIGAHTIRILTQDFDGNVNEEGVTNLATVLSETSATASREYVFDTNDDRTHTKLIDLRNADLGVRNNTPDVLINKFFRFFTACKFKSGLVTENNPGDAIQFAVDTTPPEITVEFSTPNSANLFTYPYNASDGVWYNDGFDGQEKVDITVTCNDPIIGDPRASNFFLDRSFGCKDIQYCFGTTQNQCDGFEFDSAKRFLAKDEERVFSISSAGIVKKLEEITESGFVSFKASDFGNNTQSLRDYSNIFIDSVLDNNITLAHGLEKLPVNYEQELLYTFSISNDPDFNSVVEIMTDRDYYVSILPRGDGLFVPLQLDKTTLTFSFGGCVSVLSGEDAWEFNPDTFSYEGHLFIPDRRACKDVEGDASIIISAVDEHNRRSIDTITIPYDSKAPETLAIVPTFENYFTKNYPARKNLDEETNLFYTGDCDLFVSGIVGRDLYPVYAYQGYPPGVAPSVTSLGFTHKSISQIYPTDENVLFRALIDQFIDSVTFATFDDLRGSFSIGDYLSFGPGGDTDIRRDDYGSYGKNFRIENMLYVEATQTESSKTIITLNEEIPLSIAIGSQFTIWDAEEPSNWFGFNLKLANLEKTNVQLITNDTVGNEKLNPEVPNSLLSTAPERFYTFYCDGEDPEILMETATPIPGSTSNKVSDPIFVIVRKRTDGSPERVLRLQDDGISPEITARDIIKVTDENGTEILADFRSEKIAIDPIIAEEVGYYYYNVSFVPLEELSGKINVEITVRDFVNNIVTETWSFIADEEAPGAPDLSFDVPSNFADRTYYMREIPSLVNILFEDHDDPFGFDNIVLNKVDGGSKQVRGGLNAGGITCRALDSIGNVIPPTIPLEGNADFECDFASGLFTPVFDRTDEYSLDMNIFKRLDTAEFNKMFASARIVVDNTIPNVVELDSPFADISAGENLVVSGLGEADAKFNMRILGEEAVDVYVNFEGEQILTRFDGIDPNDPNLYNYAWEVEPLASEGPAVRDISFTVRDKAGNERIINTDRAGNQLQIRLDFEKPRVNTVRIRGVKDIGEIITVPANEVEERVVFEEGEVAKTSTIVTTKVRLVVEIADMDIGEIFARTFSEGQYISPEPVLVATSINPVKNVSFFTFDLALNGQLAFEKENTLELTFVDKAQHSVDRSIDVINDLRAPEVVDVRIRTRSEAERGLLPDPVTQLITRYVTDDIIVWTWNNPATLAFDGTVIYLDDEMITNLSRDDREYISSGLNSDQLYRISVYSKNTRGSINEEPVIRSAQTLVQAESDLDAPAQVTNLRQVATTTNSITWSWENPIDEDFAKTMIYLDNFKVAELPHWVSIYTASGLVLGQEYRFTILTVDYEGNVNTEDVIDIGRI